MKRITILLAAASLPALSACGRDNGNEANMANLANIAVADQNQAAETSNPLMDVHMRMQSAMAGAQGANASETWVRKMIEHHRGAIEMSGALARLGGDPRVVEKARMTADDQRREQQELERMLQAGISGGSGPANPFGEAEARMNERMMAARGATPSETWLRMMIEHHRGAIEMADILVRQGGNPEVVALARRAAAKQTREMAELERMLGGEAAPAAAAPQAGPAEGSVAERADPRAAERPRERPAPRPQAPAPANPHAGHDMGNMANMSH